MKTILKLLIAAVIINAAVRGSLAAMHYYQFKEAAQQAVLFGASATTEDIQHQILQVGRDLELPLSPDSVLVQRMGGRTWADAAYRQEVEFFTNQTYPVDFSFSVEAHSMVLGPQGSRK
jgi:hypothetical protein